MIRTLALAALLTAGFSAQAAEDAAIKPDLEKAKSIAESVCVACHGADGNSATSAYPLIAGQGADYLFKQLKEFKAEEGKPAVRKDMKSLAVYYSQQKLKPSAATDVKLVDAGKALWRKGDFERGIPACAGCHGPTGAGIPVLYPRLSGQYADYTATQLKNFRSEERSNDPGRMMRTIADKLSDKHIKALSDYIAGLR